LSSLFSSVNRRLGAEEGYACRSAAVALV